MGHGVESKKTEKEHAFSGISTNTEQEFSSAIEKNKNVQD